jgi:hypothetical protein
MNCSFWHLSDAKAGHDATSRAVVMNTDPRAINPIVADTTSAPPKTSSSSRFHDIPSQSSKSVCIRLTLALEVRSGALSGTGDKPRH